MKRICALGIAGLLLQATLAFAQSPPPVTTLPPIADTPAACPQGLEYTIELGCDTPAACQRVWADAEFSLWWFKGAPVNAPLLTEATKPSDPTSGQIGSPNTLVLLGDQSYSAGTRFGGRFTIGGWLDPDATVGLEANYLFIAQGAAAQTFGTNGAPGSPTLAIPFIKIPPGTESALILAGPGGGTNFPGSSTLHIANQLQGSELNLVGYLCGNGNFGLIGLVGFRYLYFNEDLDYGLSNSAPASGHYFSAQDNFAGNNNFYGGQLGLRGEYQIGKFFLDATGKVALGAVNQSVDINGSSTAVNPGSPPGFNFTNARGGIFALPTNIGNHTQDAFGVLPEFTLKLGYNFTRNIQGFVGYNFLYLSDVARPGSVIDRGINLSQMPAATPAPFTLVGPPAPTFAFVRSDFWAQGINFGMQVKF